MGVFSQASWAFWYGGYPARALDAMERALGYAEDLTPLNGVIARGFAAHLAYLDDRGEVCETLAQEATRIAEEYALRPFAGWAGLHLGWARVRQGEHETGFAALAGGMEELAEAGSKLMTTAHLALYADACRIAGKVELGLELVEEGLSFAEGGERFHMPELYRLRGELLRLGGENGRAEASFRRALDLAGAPSMGARLLELRAATSLARLLADAGRDGEARNVLQKDHFFLDDVETADRRRARRLLQSL